MGEEGPYGYNTKTIAREQASWFRAKIAKAGLEFGQISSMRTFELKL